MTSAAAAGARILVSCCGLIDEAIAAAIRAGGLDAESVPAGDIVEAAADASVAACVVGLAQRTDVATIYALKHRSSCDVLALAEPDADEQLLLDALGFGAGLAFSQRPEEVLTPLLALLRGEEVVPRSFFPVLLDAVFERVPSDLEELHLSRREAVACKLLEGGLTTTAIANELSISPVTARRHLSSAMHKIGAHDRSDLLRFLHHEHADIHGRSRHVAHT